MGMFDRIWFKCLDCNRPIEAQSKAGECILKDYEADAVPLKIALDIQDDRVWCDHCNKSFTVVHAPLPDTVPMGLR